jgi:hypothetical protein
VTVGVIDRGSAGWLVCAGCLAIATLPVRPLVAAAQRPAPAGKGARAGAEPTQWPYSTSGFRREP